MVEAVLPLMSLFPLDTTESSRHLAELVWSGKLRDGAFKWVDRNRDALDGMSSYVELGSKFALESPQSMEA